mgnify:CR=1 FL=1
MAISRFILSRLLQMLVVLVGTVTVLFVVLYFFVPGDAAQTILGHRATPELLQNLRQELGLDKPVWTQYGIYMWRLAHLDLGTSYELNRSVSSIILSYLPATAYLAAAALLLELAFGIGWGVLLAARRSPWLETASTAMSAVLLATPVFFLGMLLQYILASRLKLLPISGMGDWNPLNLVLPALTLAAAQMAVITGVMKTSLQGETGKLYMLAARARGLTRYGAILRHGMRNALSPVITLLALDFGILLGGTVITEIVFSWPGLGRMTYMAAKAKDVPLVIGSVLFLVSVFVIINSLVDILYGVLDPRVRMGGKRWRGT